MYFEKDMMGTYTLKGDIFFVTFCPDTFTSLTNFINAESPKAETTLAVETIDGTVAYFILEGDFRKDYQRAAKEGGMESCMDVYRANREKHASIYSMDVLLNNDKYLN